LAGRVRSAPATVPSSIWPVVVYLSQPAPTNLEIPPHKWLSASQVLIGEDDQGVA